MNPVAAEITYLPLIIYIIGVLVVVGFMLSTVIFGERHKGRETDFPWEAGIKTTGTARIRFSSKFYIYAMLFVIFDLEVVFMTAWAIAGKELGWMGYSAFLVFLVVLLAGLIYEWRVGALDWVSTDKKYSLRTKEPERK